MTQGKEERGQAPGARSIVCTDLGVMERLADRRYGRAPPARTSPRLPRGPRTTLNPPMAAVMRGGGVKLREATNVATYGISSTPTNQGKGRTRN